MTCCGIAVKMGILEVSARKMKKQTVKMETVTLLEKLTDSNMCSVLTV